VDDGQIVSVELVNARGHEHPLSLGER